MDGIATKALITVLGLIALVVLLVVVCPLITIWALNTLFGLGIGYTFANWFATVWLGALLFPKQIKVPS